jgi:hypothetical protein
MSVAIQFGSDPSREIDASADLAAKLLPGLSPVFHLDGILASKAGQKLSDALAAVFETPFKTDREAKWTIDAANVTLSFKSSATGSIRIVKSGELFSYTLGAGVKRKVSIPVPPGKAYVVLTLRVSLSIAGGAAFSGGNVGISGNISDNDEFDISNYKCFDSSELAGAAVTHAFEHFVLPFKAEGVDGLNDGDYIDFEFLGKLNLGFGVTYGVPALKLGGRSGGEVAASFSTPLGKAVVQATPEVEAGSSFRVAYAHEGTFRVVIGRQGRKDTAKNGVSLDLFRGSKRDLSTTFTAGITLNANAKFDPPAAADILIGKAAAAATANLPSGLRDAASKAIGGQLGQAHGFAGDIEKKLTALLKKGDGHKIGLELEQEKTDQDTTLFHFDFDFSRPGVLSEGFGAAMRGQCSEAIRVPGVVLSHDSYVESLFLSSTSLTLEFFDLWKYTDVTTYTRQTDAVYAGNGIFRLRGKAGLAAGSGTVGHTGQCEMYFTAEANRASGAEKVEDLVVLLNFSLTDTKNVKSAGQTFQVLDLLQAPVLAGPVADMRRALTPDSVVRVACVFDEAACRRLQPDDRRNYTAFSAAVRALDPTAPPLFARYEDWAVYNVTSWDEDGSRKPADRTQSGGNGWPCAFPSLETLDRARVRCYFEAGRHFINLCADVKQLCGNIDAAATETQYAHLLDTLNGIIHQDAPVFFLKPAFVALLEASGSKPADAKLTGLDLTFSTAVQD